MSQRPISLSPDLSRLRSEGYDIRLEEGYLLVRDVPYLDAAGAVVRGTLVKALTLSGDVAARPGDHTAFLIGPAPHDGDRRVLRAVNSSVRQQVLPGLVIVDHYLSQNAADGYADFYALVSTYVSLLAKHAEAVDPNVSAQTFPAIEADDDQEGPFLYIDTASARAGITAVNAKVASQKVAIVGLGGTGAYILDLIAKSPVAQIDLYDGDVLMQHNAFRYPGAIRIEVLRARPTKVDYMAREYSTFRRGVIAHPYFITEDNVDERLLAADFVFLAVDDNATRRMIAKHLEAADKPFVDVGMGLFETDGSLGGQVRTTTSLPGRRDHLWDQRRRLPTSTSADDIYAQNVQIVDLNALNAAFAVARWKRYAGVYADLEREHHSVYTVDGNDIINEDHRVMSQVERFRHEFVDYIPDDLDHAVLYISTRFGTVIHLCACGCGTQVVSPLDPTDYTLIYDGESVSLSPSIGNWDFACRSHYFVKHSRVLWAGDMTEEQIAVGRARDRRVKAAVYDEQMSTTLTSWRDHSPAGAAAADDVGNRSRRGVIARLISLASGPLRRSVSAARRSLRWRRPDNSSS